MADPFPGSPDRIVAFTLEEFTMAMQIGQAGATHRMPMKSPSAYGLEIEHSNGDVSGVRFGDVPLTRMIFAVKEHFGDRVRSSSWMMRWFALMDLKEDQRMELWTRSTGTGEDERIEIFDGDFEAAAVLPLQSDWLFAADDFFAYVERFNERVPDDDKWKLRST